MSRRPSDTTTSGEASGSGSGLGSSSGSASGSGARSNASSPLPLSSVEERVQKSIDLWARDLRSLFEHARERFADVAWETESNGRIWAHKGELLCRCWGSLATDFFLVTSPGRRVATVHGPELRWKQGGGRGAKRTPTVTSSCFRKKSSHLRSCRLRSRSEYVYHAPSCMH
jgi:hypothetical protein